MKNCKFIMVWGESYGCRERIALFGYWRVEVWLLHCQAVWTSDMLRVLCQWPGREFEPEFGTGIGIRWGVLGMWDYSTKGVRVRLIEINIKKKPVVYKSEPSIIIML